MSYSFATADLRLKESEVPEYCQEMLNVLNEETGLYEKVKCGHKIHIYDDSAECTNWPACEWHAEIKKETEPERPDTYDWVLDK